MTKLIITILVTIGVIVICLISSVVMQCYLGMSMCLSFISICTLVFFILIYIDMRRKK